MLAQAHKLKPECAFVQTDVRSCRLRTTFDALLVEDTILHTNRLEDFKAALRTAHAMWHAVLHRTGFEMHEGRCGEAEKTCTVFACMRLGECDRLRAQGRPTHAGSGAGSLETEPMEW